MGRVIILPETTQNPITLMGERAGICYGSDTTDKDKNYARGLDCLKSKHGRVMEYVNIEVVLEGYSARTIREWYTHIGCLPTRLQSSTRYIDYKNFKYVTPPEIEANHLAKQIYDDTMKLISEKICELMNLGVSKEDAAMILPLGMETKIVDKRNLRNVVDMSHQRKCRRAYREFRELFSDYCNSLKKISSEWELIIDMEMMPKCKYLGYCPEMKPCGEEVM